MNSKNGEVRMRFQELVESCIEGSITDEQSRELLQRVRADEALRHDFAGQLQVAGMLREGADGALQSLESAVLAGLAADGGGSRQRPRRSLRWSTVFIRAAAVLVAAFVVLKYVNTGEEKRAAEPASQRDAAMTVKSPIVLKESYEARYNGRRQAASDAPVAEREAADKFYDYRDDDIKIEAAQAGAAVRTERAPALKRAAEEQQRMVPLQIETPKPKFVGTPKDIRTANLESPEEKRERDGDYRWSSADAPAAIAPMTMPPPRPPQIPSGESYARIEENAFLNPAEKPLSTFSVDVDTASYANLRRMLNGGQMPPPDAVRIEEMINYFEYAYEGPGDDTPFSTALALHRCPWNENHRLLRVGLQGRRIDEQERKPSNLVFLLDVSGSMNTPDKLPLLKTGMRMLVRALSENDRVAVVVYAGSTGLVLDSTSAAEKERIIDAIERLSAGGSTAGGEGIQLAYRVAQDNFIRNGVNRVILATDGDFNVGVSSHEGLERLISEKRGSGIFLSVLGFGSGNLQDSKMELLANKGNGNYFYIDSEREAQKVLVRQLNATLVTIAKDVKIQVEFNPEHVSSYRLIGYENRRMAARDFDDDTKDAGEIGAGHQVTALYEIVPAGAPDAHDGVVLKYGRKDAAPAAPSSGEMLTVKLRYKEPEGDASRLLEFPYTARDIRDGAGDDSFRWAASVAAFGQILRNSPHAARFTLRDVHAMAAGALGEDPHGYRAEFIRLVERAAALKGDAPPVNDKGYPLWQYRR